MRPPTCTHRSRLMVTLLLGLSDRLSRSALYLFQMLVWRQSLYPPQLYIPSFVSEDDESIRSAAMFS